MRRSILPRRRRMHRRNRSRMGPPFPVLSTRIRSMRLAQLADLQDDFAGDHAVRWARPATKSPIWRVESMRRSAPKPRKAASSDCWTRRKRRWPSLAEPWVRSTKSSATNRSSRKPPLPGATDDRPAAAQPPAVAEWSAAGARSAAREWSAAGRRSADAAANSPGPERTARAVREMRVTMQQFRVVLESANKNFQEPGRLHRAARPAAARKSPLRSSMPSTAWIAWSRNSPCSRRRSTTARARSGS